MAAHNIMLLCKHDGHSRGSTVGKQHMQGLMMIRDLEMPKKLKNYQKACE